MKLNKLKKTVLALIAVFVMTLVFALPAFADESPSYTNEETGSVVAVIDAADLLSSSEEKELLESMKEITEYCNAFFVTSDELHYSSVSDFAKELNNQLASRFGVSSADSTTFLIDMYDREMYIYSGTNVYKVITKANANTITDNTYTYASKGDYYRCAEETFIQIYKILDGQEIARPMKYITAALLAIFIGLFVGYIILRIKTKNKNDSALEETGNLLNNKCKVEVFNAILTNTIKRRHVESDGGGSSGGGGGGSSGGGGGGGGGGHSF